MNQIVQAIPLLNTLSANWTALLTLVGALVVALLSVVHSLQLIAAFAKKLALLTASKADDDAVDKLTTVLLKVHSALDWAQKFLPRMTLDTKVAPAPELVVARVSTMRPPPPSAAA